ncbi:arf-GAP with dual PH domain-containing protein 2 [Myotis lucifugus]|uniref:arf-GAP with dual PH domain-containing protein 2 n=1 Tax=Myotis lucifugus TaxID=59463 RepID=UPI0006D728A2|nr:arf-GAP with dual PH domain-containing protein 2 [Myotis lucifugus]
MTHNGNLRVKAKYEARVPAFYYIPQASDCLVLKEQWIRAKYERQEFMADGKTISLSGNREGFLWKRGRDNAQFLRRRFVLLAREGLLKYYTKEEGKSPKAVIHIKDLNATFQTEKIGNPHGLQITYRREGHIRNLFVYHESGKFLHEMGISEGPQSHASRSQAGDLKVTWTAVRLWQTGNLYRGLKQTKVQEPNKPNAGWIWSQGVTGETFQSESLGRVFPGTGPFP